VSLKEVDSARDSTRGSGREAISRYQIDRLGLSNEEDTSKEE
jgi:hypothetical protein